MNKPRYDIAPTQDGWAVTDDLALEPLAVLSSREAAHEAAMALNRGLVETVTPDGRWPEISELLQIMNELGTPRDKQWLQDCCELVKAKMPENYSFVVFGFPISGTDRCYYASNATRESAVEALKEWIAHSDANFGKHHQ